MTTPGISHGREAIPASEAFADYHDRIRETVRRVDADQLTRQLPNLVDTVASESTNAPEIIHFLIGVSFSNNDTLLDYRLDKYVQTQDPERPRYETVKEPINADHLYLTFPYPPDPNFTAETLRGALLVEIEEQFSRHGHRRGNSSNPNGRTTSKIGQLWKKFGLF